MYSENLFNVDLFQLKSPELDCVALLCKTTANLIEGWLVKSSPNLTISLTAGRELFATPPPPPPTITSCSIVYGGPNAHGCLVITAVAGLAIQSVMVLCGRGLRIPSWQRRNLSWECWGRIGKRRKRARWASKSYFRVTGPFSGDQMLTPHARVYLVPGNKSWRNPIALQTDCRLPFLFFFFFSEKLYWPLHPGWELTHHSKPNNTVCQFGRAQANSEEESHRLTPVQAVPPHFFPFGCYILTQEPFHFPRMH